MKVTKGQLADLLHNTEYKDGIPENLVELARENGLVIVYGASDDLIEFDGAIHDEAYVSHNSVIQFDKEGIIPEWDSIEKEEEQEVREYFQRKDISMPTSLNVFWGTYPYSWTYACSIPHAQFDIVEGDEKYCRGLVFELSEVAGF